MIIYLYDDIKYLPFSSMVFASGIIPFNGKPASPGRLKDSEAKTAINFKPFNFDKSN